MFAEWLEGPSREDGFYGEIEEFRESKGEFEAWAIVAALEKADGLVIDVEGVSQLLSGDTALGAENGNAVEKATFPGRVLRVCVSVHIEILR